MHSSLRAFRAVLVVSLCTALVGGCGGDEAGELAGSSQVTSSSHAATVGGTITAVPTITSVPASSLLDVLIADPNFGGLPSSLGEELARLPTLVAVSPFRSAGAVVDGEDVQFVAVDPSTVGLLFDLGVVEGSVEDLAGGGVMLLESRARDLGVGVGDLVAVAWQRGGSQQLEVVGVFTDSPVSRG